MGRRAVTWAARVAVVAGLGLVTACADPPTDQLRARFDAQLADEAFADAFARNELVEGDAVARVVIAAIGVDVVTVEGLGHAALESGAGHDPTTALPCTSGTSTLLGGRTVEGRSFAGIERLTAGDRVEVITPIGVCTYDVVDLVVVALDELLELEPVAERELLLVTSTPDEGDDDTLRLVVRARLVGGTTDTTVPSTSTTVPVVQLPAATGREAVLALLAAWRAGDLAVALTVADPGPVDQLFAVAPEAGEDRGCTQGSANPNVTCVFRLPSGELQVRATPRAGGFIVDFLILSGA